MIYPLGRHTLAILTLILALFFALTPTHALQENLAGIADWHKPLIGKPLLTPTPPTFVNIASGRRILAITERNVLASLHAASGDIAWRHLLEDVDPVVSFHVSPDSSSVLLLSGPSGSQARLFSLESGHVLWERTIVHLEGAHLTSPIHLGTDVAYTLDGQSIVILCDGRRVTKLGISTGDIEWSLDAPGAGSTMLFKQLLITSNRVHILALTSSFASNTLTTLTLDLTTSAPQSDLTQIPSIVTLPTSSFLTTSTSSTAARVVWLEHGRIRTVYLSEDGTLGDSKDLMPGKGHTFVGVEDVGVREKGLLLGKKENGAVVIIDAKSGGKIVDEFENSHDSGDKSSSVYSASARGESVTISRVYWSFSMGLSVAQTYTISDKGSVISTGFTFPFKTSDHGVILHAGISNTVSSAEMPSLLLSTSTGAIQHVQQDKTLWTREEALSDIVAVRFIELGEPKVEEARHAMAEESFPGRLFRQTLEIRHLPGYILRSIHRLLTGSGTSSSKTPALDPQNIHGDRFGFQKLLVAITKPGKMYAMDSANGQTLWTRSLGLSSGKGEELEVDSMWIVREGSDVGGPMLAVVAVRDIEGMKNTVAVHVDALTGEVRGDKDEKTGLARGKVVFAGPPSSVFPLPFENCGSKIRVLAIANTEQLEIFPFCKKVAADLLEVSSTLHFTAQTTTPPTLTGYIPISPIHPNHTFSTLPLWSQSLSPTERLISFTPNSFGIISSYGRPLGDKSTLYKYLNPHTYLFVTHDAVEKRGRVKVLDSVSGRIVWGVEVGECEDVKGVMGENWVVWAWQGAEGWRLGSGELYEDRSGDNRVIDSPGVSSHSPYHRIRAITQTFIAPSDIKSMAITTSQFEVTAKELVYVNARNQVASIPRRLLDPRRPKGKPTSADKEEMLIPYDPYIGADTRRVVSHNYEVLGIKSLISSPALIESTSLLFAHGLDLFFTRALTPSGTFDILSDSFNKAQILLTLAVLGGGIMVARPAVTRKALKARWY